MNHPESPDFLLFFHIRVVLGIILGLAITTLLRGVSKFIEHPARFTVSLIHLGWAGWAFFTIITYWWWEFGLGNVTGWTFPAYSFVIVYCSLYFFLAVLLFPDDLSEYESHEDYFLKRRRWFFGVFLAIIILDLADTALKGADYFSRLGWDYPVQMVASASIGITGFRTGSLRIHRILPLIAVPLLLYAVIDHYFRIV